MARMTSTELEIQDVVDRWIREDGRFRIHKFDREYTALVDALGQFLRQRDQMAAEKFKKAVEVAYQNGYNAGRGVKG